MPIKSPLNYTGNKFRILNQMLPHFPQNIGHMVDLFCGGATVGLNTECERVTFVDNNPFVIGLLQFLAVQDVDHILADLEALILHYHLSYSARDGYAFYSAQEHDANYNNGLKEYNTNGFYQLRADYNALEDKQTPRAYLMLYALLVYGFNNDLRFSRDNHYNLPVGKTDLNANNIRKIREYIERIHQIDTEFVCGDFRDAHIRGIINAADFVYMDPPYLITNAVYNESGRWGEQAEIALLDMMSDFILAGKPFVLSNILTKSTAHNHLLEDWIHEHQDAIHIVDIDYHYRGASYNKIHRDGNEREIIVTTNF